MSDDTTMGGTQAPFPSTIWSDVLAAADPTRLALLCRAYWRPVYAYIRTAWRKPVEEAKDLTQAFFARLLEKGHLERARPERGSFRGYLKMSLRNFLIDAQRAEEVRRPEKPVFSIDAPAEELPAASDESPEAAYDREWFRALLDASIAELERRLRAADKGRYFDVFRVYCLEQPEARPTYREVAARVGLKETDISNHLAVCRATLTQIMRDRIRDYVAEAGDVDTELREALRP